MAARAKGTQTPAGLSEKPDWFLRQQEGQAKRLEGQRENNENVMFAQGFTQKKDLGGGMMQYTRPEAGGAVGSSFGRMMGGVPQMGGGISMGGLEAASMRLADAAAKRERETIGYETGMKKELMASERKFEQQKELDTEIRSLQMQIAEVGATPKTPQSVSLYNSLRKQLENLKSQRNSIR